MNNTVKKVGAGSVDKLQKILGTFDENLNIIMRELGVLIRVDGVTFVIEGAEEKTVQAASVIESLLTLAENGETVESEDIAATVDGLLENAGLDPQGKYIGITLRPWPGYYQAFLGHGRDNLSGQAHKVQDGRTEKIRRQHQA